MMQAGDAGNVPAGAEFFEGKLADAGVAAPVSFIEVQGGFATRRDAGLALDGAVNLELKGGG